MTRSVPVAVFDFDGTLIRGDSIAALVRFALRRRAFPALRLPGLLAAAALFRLGRLNAESAKSAALAHMGRMDAAECAAFHRDFAQSVLLPAVFPRAKEKMSGHASRGDVVLLVSASPDVYMNHMKELLPVSAVLATPVDANGRVGRNCRGREKLRRICRWLKDNGLRADWEASWAYADSPDDLPVLKLVGHPVCVNPKPSLRRMCANMALESWKRGP